MCSLLLLLLTRPAGLQRCMLHAVYWHPCSRIPIVLLVVWLLPLLLAHLLAHWLA
jgi:hypothetical protein